MVALFQSIHSFFYGLNQQKDFKHKNRLAWFGANVLARLFELLSYYFILFRGKIGFLPPALKNGHQLVVSFTSFPDRINGAWMVVDCLMRQSFLPSAIYLYLSRDQFPHEKDDLPSNILKYEKLGLKIIFVDDDLKPHKKYFYISQTLNGECFVTVDDDVLYRRDMLSRLWSLHEKYPDSVCANYGRRIAFGENGTLPYANWNVLLDDKIHNNELDTIAIGFGGILYPSCFYKNISLICDAPTIKETCLRADDLWLKVMELKTDTPLVISTYYANPPSIRATAKSALSVSNRRNGTNGNDLQWKALERKFKLCFPLENKKENV